MNLLKIKREKVEYINILTDPKFVQFIAERSIDIVKNGEKFLASEPIVSVGPTENNQIKIHLQYEVLKPNWFQKLYYIKYMGLNAEDLKKISFAS